MHHIVISAEFLLATVIATQSQDTCWCVHPSITQGRNDLGNTNLSLGSELRMTDLYRKEKEKEEKKNVMFTKSWRPETSKV